MIPEQGYPDLGFGAWVAGTVKQPDGRPVTGAAVTVTVPDTGLQVGAARSAPSGTYKVGLARSGTYLVIVSAPGRRPAADLVTAGEGPTRHDVVLGGSGVLAGVARMADAGDPVAGVVVTLTDARGQVVAAATTSTDGEYRLDGLDAGDYTLAGTARGMRPVARAVTVPGTEDLTFAAPAHQVSAIVTGPDGAPFAGAVVTLSGRDGDVATQVSDGEGSVTFADIPAGGYTLAAEGTGPGVAVARAVRGQVARADIRLGTPARARPLRPLRHADDTTASGSRKTEPLRAGTVERIHAV